MIDAVIDFESFYNDHISVVGQGVPNYVASTEAYMVSVVANGEGVCGTIEEMRDFCNNLAQDPAARPVAANANFDNAWWDKYYAPFRNPWYCVLDQGVFHQFPRHLAGLAKVVLGEKVDKTLRDKMKGVRYEGLPEPEKKALMEYCLNDSVKESEIHEKLGPMSMVEEKVAAHTRMMNRRGVAIDLDLVDKDKTRLEEMRFEALKQIPWHADAKPLSYLALVKYCVAHGIEVPKSLAKTSDECAGFMKVSPELNAIVTSMRDYRRSNTILEKAKTLLARATPEGILPLDFLYCGAAHTRRWSCRGFNVQNLDKEPFSVARTDKTVWTRNWLIPRPGKKFLLLDMAQIEPRCLNWLAGNDVILAAMREGFSIYEAFARVEGWKGAPGAIKQELGKKGYTLLKNRSLGLGYGMGAPRFVSYVRANGGDITLAEAQKTVSAFRTRYQLIVKFWRRLDNLMRSAAQQKDRHLILEMPTGDTLQHFGICPNRNAYTSYTTLGDYSHNSKVDRLFGGALAENVTQRMARDILAEAILRLEDAGFPVIFHSHDEVVLEAGIDSNEEEVLAEASALMTRTPEWAPGLPLGVEGTFESCYTKH